MLSADDIARLIEIGEAHLQELMGSSIAVSAADSDSADSGSNPDFPATIDDDAGCSGSEQGFDPCEVRS